MSPCNSYRSFAILLAIVFATINSPTSGFTIPRAVNFTDESDLTGEESSVLTVRHEQKRPNDINNNENNKSDSKEKFETKLNPHEISSDTLISKINEFTAGISTLNDFNKKFTSSKINNDFSFIYGEIETQTKPTPIQPFKLTTGFTTTRDNVQFDFPSSITTKSVTPRVQNNHLTDTTTTAEFFTSNIPSTYDSRLSLEQQNKDLGNSTPKNYNSKLKTFTFGNDLTSITLSVDELYSLRDLASSVTEALPTEQDREYSKVTNTYFNGELSPTVPIKSSSTGITRQYNKPEYALNYAYSTPMVSTNLDTGNLGSKIAVATTTIGSVNSFSTEPLWRKYTNIERGRLTTDTSTATTTKELNRAETSQKIVNFDKAFSPDPTAPFEKYTANIISINNKLLTTTNAFSTATEQDYTIYDFTTPTIISRPRKVGIVSSKMAGFLDFSKVSSPNVNIAENTETTENIEDSETSTLYETTLVDIATTTETPTTTPTTSTTTTVVTTEQKSTKPTDSQSQLVDDTINEELLKEELMKNNENAKRIREERPDIHDLKEVKPLASEVTNINNLASNRTEDTLIVQPINHEKIKNTLLYAVSPKYKPMKKIDIQPPKQFVRDPDDNSWRNEGISSLGIVFKPKNSSKSFTEVLKNKTEVQLNNLTGKDSKSGLPDLRQRLEKIAEVRKSKKKKKNKYGETVFVDYEESSMSAEVLGLKKKNNTKLINFKDAIKPNVTDLSNGTLKKPETLKTTNGSKQEIDDIFRRFELDALTTEKPKNLYNVAEYYDTTDEYEVDYSNISNIDLKKHTIDVTKVTTILTTPQTPSSTYAPNRKATVEYFPPTTKKVKVNTKDNDESFPKKGNLYTVEALPKELRKALSPAPFVTLTTPSSYTDKFEEIKSTLSGFQPSDFSKDLYFSDKTRVTEQPNAFVNEPDLIRGSYVIKHYKDFLNVAAKDDDYRNGYVTFTEAPVNGITISDLVKQNGLKAPEDDYDYEQHFRKDILDRFVANFNQNSERFKVDFPILFNNSVVHRKVDENGKVLASSTAFMKRLYDATTTKSDPYVIRKSCEPNCEKITVELSPAYELHYYVPEQEEKEEAEPPVSIGYHRLRS